MQQTLRTITALALALLPTVAAAEKTLDSAAGPDPKAAITSWTPGQQWAAADDGKLGNGPYLLGQLLLADELGTHLSELGRVRAIQKCLHHQMKPDNGMVAWSICRQDVKALDMKKLEAELAAEGIVGGAKTKALEWINDIVKTAKLTGDPIEALAKSDPGVAAVLKVGDDARAEWTAYEAKNTAVVDRYVALKDAVRSARGNDKAFSGCYEVTQPAFAKLVKDAAPKIPYDVGRSDTADGYTPNYLYYIMTSKEAYLATVSYGACLWSMNDAGGHLFRIAGSAAFGRAIAGPRTLAASRLLAETFKPKFADRSLTLERGTDWNEGPRVSAAGAYDKDVVNAEGQVATMKVDGENTKIVFRGEYYEGCLQYGNDVNKTCLKKGQMYDSVGEGVAFTKFLAGVKPNLHLAIKFGFPEVVWDSKTKKVISILTIPVAK